MSQLFFLAYIFPVKSYPAYERIVARAKLNVKMLVYSLFCFRKAFARYINVTTDFILRKTFDKTLPDCEVKIKCFRK